MDVHPTKNGINRYWSIAKWRIQTLPVSNSPIFFRHSSWQVILINTPIDTKCNSMQQQPALSVSSRRKSKAMAATLYKAWHRKRRCIPEPKQLDLYPQRSRGPQLSSEFSKRSSVRRLKLMLQSTRNAWHCMTMSCELLVVIKCHWHH